MVKYDGNRTTKAATPQAGGALNLSNRVVGSNPRKQKLTEAAGTNPGKLGATKLDVGSPTVGNVGDRRYAQDTAPHKQMNIEYPFSVGGPGFPKPMK